MRASRCSATRGASQPKKNKAVCDQCNASKVKCPGGGPPCKRCADRSQPCHYSLARRIGKPPGSKNRKTLERLRQAKDGNLENNGGGGGGDSSIPQSNGGRNDGDGALNVESERREGNNSHNSLQMSSTMDFRPLSPLINYPSYPDSSQFILTPELYFLDGDHFVCSDGDDRSVFNSADLQLLHDFQGLGRAELRGPWTNALDDYWIVSTRPCCAPTLTDKRISLHHQALISSSLPVPRTLVCSTQYSLCKIEN